MAYDECPLFYIGFEVQYKSTYPHTGYPDRLGPSCYFVENATNLISLEITRYGIEYDTVDIRNDILIFYLYVNKCVA
jgi:hypothetical protein